MSLQHQRHVIYVDPEGTGHHLALYARALWNEFLARGWRVTWLTSPHARQHPAAPPLLDALGGRIDVVEAPFPRAPLTGNAPWQALRYQWRHCRTLRRALPRIASPQGSGCVFHACLDQCDRLFGLTRWPRTGRPWAGIHMTAVLDRGEIQVHRPGSRLKAGLSRHLTLRSYRHPVLQRIFVLDPHFAAYARTPGLPGGTKVRCIPDLTLPGQRLARTPARRHLGISEAETCILCFGMMTDRKGILLLAEALRLHPPDVPVVVVIAGEQSPEFRARLQAGLRLPLPARVRYDVRAGFVPAEEENRLFAAADLVWVGYPDFKHSSGVLIRAAEAGLPCLGGAGTAIAAEIARLDCGIVCDLSQPAAIARAVSLRGGNASAGASSGHVPPRNEPATTGSSGAEAIVTELATLLAEPMGTSPAHRRSGRPHDPTPAAGPIAP